MTALVLVLVGTDHHPFDRMVEWVDATAAGHPEARFVVQHGASRPPRVAEGHRFLTHARIVELLQVACGVVCHGGPGTIMDARDAGHVPVCMARDPRLGEHVDGHQQRFVRLVGAAGVVRAVAGAGELRAAVEDLLLPDAANRRAAVDVDPVTARARTLLTAELDRLLLGPRTSPATSPLTTPLTTPVPRRLRRVALTRGATR